MRKLLLLLVIVVGAFGLWWWESPRLATENLLDAAGDNDVAELETLIDADRFTASVRAQLPEVPAGLPRPASAPPLPETRPATGDPLLSGLARDAELVALRQAARTEWEIEHLGFNTFRVVRRTGEGKPLPALYFERDWFSWKLVGVDVTP
jgi:hypothetical protein